MNTTRTRQVVLRLSDSELDQLHEKVKQSGMKQQEYLLRTALDIPIRNTNGLKELLLELKRQGSNLNQIAKALNQRGYVDYNGDLKRALEGQTEVWQLLKRYLHALQ